jgi:hypothetical protein
MIPAARPGNGCRRRTRARRLFSTFVIPIRRLSKRFHVAAEKSPSSSRGIVSKLRTIERANQWGTVMTITEYLSATALVALILWAVLGLLIQEN